MQPGRVTGVCGRFNCHQYCQCTAISFSVPSKKISRVLYRIRLIVQL